MRDEMRSDTVTNLAYKLSATTGIILLGQFFYDLEQGYQYVKIC